MFGQHNTSKPTNKTIEIGANKQKKVHEKNNQKWVKFMDINKGLSMPKYA